VFIVGLEEGILPHRESIDAGDVDEERRLMYVGVTRAQAVAASFVVPARKRAGEKVACQPSRFIAELAQEDLRYSNAPLTQAEAAQEKVAGNAPPAVAEGNPVAMKRGSVRRFDHPRRSLATSERCRIVEVSNSEDDPDVSVARARVAPGVVTRWHRVAGTAERYVILEGTGRVEVGGYVREVVSPRRTSC
jgi:quercetin dioxygenase-like cupin family protein